MHTSCLKRGIPSVVITIPEMRPVCTPFPSSSSLPSLPSSLSSSSVLKFRSLIVDRRPPSIGSRRCEHRLTTSSSINSSLPLSVSPSLRLSVSPSAGIPSSSLLLCPSPSPLFSHLMTSYSISFAGSSVRPTTYRCSIWQLQFLTTLFQMKKEKRYGQISLMLLLFYIFIFLYLYVLILF